jgi:anti-sigma regulatory factor (Ser/Thr protein kinase)
MRSLVGSEVATDDIALLALRMQGGDGHAPLDMHVPAVPTSLTLIRTAVRRWLLTSNVTGDDANDILLATGEATANAVEHAYGPSGGTVALHVALDGADVVVTVTDTGRWREPRGENRGRGTMIMKRCMDDVVVRSDGDGTSITMRRRVEQEDR